MKKIIYILGAMFFFLTGMVNAQQQLGRLASADEIMTRMKSDLNLTADQVNDIKPILEKTTAERQKLFQNLQTGRADKDTISSQLQDITQEEDLNLKYILNPDQWNKLNEMKKNVPTILDFIVSKMQAAYNLTPDQVDAIKPIVEKNMAERQQLMIQIMKNANGNKSNLLSQMQELNGEEGKELSQILTQDQMKKWNNMNNVLSQ